MKNLAFGESVKFELLASDFRKGDYTNPNGCALSLAIKRVFGVASAEVSGVWYNELRIKLREHFGVTETKYFRLSDDADGKTFGSAMYDSIATKIHEENIDEDEIVYSIELTLIEEMKISI